MTKKYFTGGMQRHSGKQRHTLCHQIEGIQPSFWRDMTHDKTINQSTEISIAISHVCYYFFLKSRNVGF